MGEALVCVHRACETRILPNYLQPPTNIAMVQLAATDPSPVVTTPALVAGACVRCMGVAVRSEYTSRAELPPGSPGIPSEETSRHMAQRSDAGLEE